MQVYYHWRCWCGCMSVIVYAWSTAWKTLAGKTNSRLEQTSGSNYMATLFHQCSFSLSLSSQSPFSFSVSFHPFIPFGNSSLIKKKRPTPNKPVCVSVWPLIVPLQTRTLTSGKCWQLQTDPHETSKCPDASPDLTAWVKECWMGAAN